MIQFLMALTISAFAALPEANQINKPEAIDKYDLTLNYSILNQHFGVPTYVITEGQETSLVKESGGKKYYLDIMAENQPTDKGVLRMVFLAGVLNPDGTKTQVSRSALVARLGERSKMSVSNEEGKSEMSLTVVVRKKEPTASK